MHRKGSDAMQPIFETTRKGLLDFALLRYHDQPEYLWRSSPGHAVLRHAENRKWYLLVMNLPREKLGMPGGGSVDVAELKCDPILSGSLRGEPGILPAYHMNRDSWITVLLDGSVDPERLAFLLDVSYTLTGPGRAKNRAPRQNRDWLIPANPAVYDVEQDFARYGTIFWKQTTNVRVGDPVYLYMAAPVSAVLHQCVARQVEIREDGPDGPRRLMKLKLVRRFSPQQLSRAVLQQHGIRTVRGPRGLTNSLRHYIGILPEE